MSVRFLVGAFALAVVFAGAAGSASAAPILIQADFVGGPPPPNDCNGVFGGGANGPCDVGFALGAEVSPYIVKIDANGTVDQVNPGFPSIDGSEFSFGGGTWSYNPGPGDPAVRFWVAKGGNTGFSLFWFVEGTTVGNACDGNPYNLACLSLALAVTSGTYTVPSGGLSHITFYDSGRTEVSEPVTMALFGLGALGAGIVRRRFVA